MNIIPLYIFTLFFLTLAFIGLLGAYYQHIHLRTSHGGDLKHTGKKAIVWGLLVFLGFSIFPLIIMLRQSILENILLVSISFIFALLHKKYN